MKRLAPRLFIFFVVITLHTSILQPLQAQTNKDFAKEAALIGGTEIRPDSLDFIKFPPAKEVVIFGIGVWGAYKGTVNTFADPDRPASSPTINFTNGISLDIRPTIDYGITLYAPTLFAEKIGINLDLGLSSYTFGMQYYTNFILTDKASTFYKDFIVARQPNFLSADSASKVAIAQNERFPKFFTTLQYLTISPMFNFGGLLVGANIGLPLFSGTITTPEVSSLKMQSSTETIQTSLIEMLVEPRIGIQVPLISGRFGSLFLNAQASASLPFLGAALKPAGSRITDNIMKKALDDLKLPDTVGSKYRFSPTSPEVDPLTKKIRSQEIEPYQVYPFSASVGLSFILSVGNNNDQLDELLREERRSDSLRLVNSAITRRLDSARQRSIRLADQAITTIIQSSKISDRIAALEKNQLEQQKTALKTELTDTKKRVFQAQFTTITGTNDDGSETAENPTLRIEQFQAKTSKAILPKVFFDQGSALVSTRYKRIQSAEREAYKLPSEAFAPAYSLYPNVLNIVGKRLSTSTAKVSLTGSQSADETDATLAQKRTEAIAAYLQDIWKIPATRIIKTVSKNKGNNTDSRTVEISSDNGEITAPLGMDYTARLAVPPVINVGIDISTGAGLKQWELEIQQLVNNQGVVLKDTNGGSTFPPRFVWRLNEEPATMPQSSESVTMRIGAFDINNAAAPDAPLKTLKVEQITLEQKRANKTPDKMIHQFEFVFASSLAELDASSKKTLETAKSVITPQSKVFITVYGGNSSVSARAVAQALNLDAKSAVLRDAGTVPNASQLPEAQAYNRLVRIRVEAIQ